MYALVPLVILVTFGLLYMMKADRVHLETSEAALRAFTTSMTRYHLSALEDARREIRLDPELAGFEIEPTLGEPYRFLDQFHAEAHPAGERGEWMVATWLDTAEIGTGILRQEDLGRLELWTRGRFRHPRISFGVSLNGRVDELDLPALLFIPDSSPVMISWVGIHKQSGGEAGQEEEEGEE